jgi:hypothetical protein
MSIRQTAFTAARYGSQSQYAGQGRTVAGDDQSYAVISVGTDWTMIRSRPRNNRLKAIQFSLLGP